MEKRVRFPIIKRIEVLGFPMYPGGGHGLTKDLQPGVNVIVGINGLGKTTLLNIMLRLLLGPYDPKKADAREPGAKLHELIHLKKFGYFASRIGADARNSTASLTLAFGDDEVRIVRDLGPQLSIKELWWTKSGVITNLVDPDEARYEGLIKEVCGIQTRYDFDFVVRNFLFFLEDKVPLIWNPRGQFEILRILFLDDELSSRASKLHDNLMQVDSEYRNLYWVVNREEDELNQSIRDAESNGDNTLNLEASRNIAEAVADKLRILEESVSDLMNTLEATESDLFRKQSEVYNCQLELELIEREFFQRSFPNVPEVTQQLLGNLLAEDTCLICGSNSQNAKNRIKSLLSTCQCPACESILPKTNIIPTTEFDSARAKNIENQITSGVQAIESMKRTLMDCREELENNQNDYYAEVRKKAEIDHQINIFASKSTPNDEKLEAMRSGFLRRKQNLEILRTKRSNLQIEYDDVLSMARDRISAVADEVVSLFSTYAQDFLVEDCSLSYEMHKRSVGVGGVNMNFPCFQLQMSSSASLSTTHRESADEVSESQKEFIDLAFRMALLEVAATDTGPGMLVIETPEASLDSIFIARAGKMLSEFANKKRGDKSNVLISSTNLNSEHMLQHLLGIEGNIEDVDQQKAILDRIINLLRIAAPSKAYIENKEAYDNAFNHAVGFQSQ